jgi:hypothetical protein
MSLFAANGIDVALRRWGLGLHPGLWRLPPIETYPRVVAFAQTWPGKLVIFAAFALLLRGATGLWLELTVAAAVVSLAGQHRHIAAFLCTAVLLARAPDWFRFTAAEVAVRQERLAGVIHIGYLRAGTLVAFLLLAAALLYLARPFRDHPIGRRPVLAQHVVCIALIALATSHLLHGVPQVMLWGFTATFCAYFWFLAFALLEQRQRQPPSLTLQLATFHPFFALRDTVIPLGRGAATWRNAEADSPETLAVTQLKGLKLLVWANLLMLALLAFRRLVYGKLGVVPIKDAFERFLADAMAAGLHSLLSILANFPEQLLLVAASGHAMIATARLAGFRLLRNTYRPLSSRTIAEFWNRYMYYFKEVLVHVYFYPTYLRWFKGHPKLRLAVATFMAAGVGNFFMHFILNSQFVAAVGWSGAFRVMQTYAFYCALLAAGIVVSQLRARQFDPRGSWWREQLVPSIGVALFFCLLSFFDGPQRHVGLTRHLEFLFKAFGIG